jgi:hypothetical protein
VNSANAIARSACLLEVNVCLMRPDELMRGAAYGFKACKSGLR